MVVNRPLSILIVAIGSTGDIHPNIGLGLALKKRGHKVSLIANSYFEKLIINSGLRHIALGSVKDYIKISENPAIWSPKEGFEAMAEMLINLMKPLYQIIKDEYVPDETVITGSNFAIGARVASEKLKIPMASVYISPAAIRSIHDQIPIMALPEVSRYFPSAIKKFVFVAVDYFVMDKVLTPSINSFRSELALSPIRNIFGKWIHSPQMVIGLFPNWFAPPQIDWPPNTYLTGFPLFDPIELGGDWVNVERFISNDPPIVFAACSIKKDLKEFFEVSVEVCRILKRRGIFICKFSEYIPTDLPDYTRHFHYIPFAKLLPKSVALVHQGSLGNAAQALRAGIPQLTMPEALDHPEIADRLNRLGVGLSIKPDKYQAHKVADGLKYLLESPVVTKNCRFISGKIKEEESLSEASRLIEQLSKTTKEEV